MTVGESASTAGLKNREYEYESEPGKQEFGVLTLESAAKLDHQENMVLECEYLHMRRSATISAQAVKAEISRANLEGGAVIKTSGQGEISEAGLGAGNSAGGVGSGGGHGGQGGGSNNLPGGQGYGSYTHPVHPGSGGGGSNGGRGGSTIKASKSFVLTVLISNLEYWIATF